MKSENVLKVSKAMSNTPSWISPDDDRVEQIFKTFSCPACRSITIMLYETVISVLEQESLESTNISDRFLEEEVNQFKNRYKRVTLYSPRRKGHQAIPQAVQDVLNQAESVIPSSPRASFILCRAVLEEICNDFSIPTEQQTSKGKIRFISLHDRLATLFSQEKLPGNLQEIIRHIKDFGNEGAHSNHLQFVEKVTTEDATNLFLLINYVLERLYIDRYRQKEAEEMLNDLKKRVLPNQKS